MRGSGVADPQEVPADLHLTALARGGTASFFGVVASALFGFALVVIVTRGFTPTEVGVFFEAVALFSLAMSVAVWGADIGLVRTIPRLTVLERDRDIRPVVAIAATTVFAIALVLAAVIFLSAGRLAGLVASGVPSSSVASLIRASAPFLPAAAVYAVLLAATRGFGRMGPTNAIDRIGRAAAQPILALVVALLGMGSVALIVGWALPSAIGCVVAGAWLVAMIRRRTAADGRSVDVRPDRRSLIAEFWRFSAPRGLAGVFAVAVLWLDTLLIGALRSTQEAGVYAAATRYLVFGGFASQAVIQAIGPTMSELLTRRDLDTARSVYGVGTAWAMAVGWPVYLLLAVFAPAALSVFGPGYAEAEAAITILALTMLVASGVGPVDIVLLMAGKSTWNLANTAAAVVLNVVLNLLLVPRFGITGAAIAWSVSILTNNLAPLMQVRALVGLHPLGAATAAAGVAALVAFGVVPLAVRAGLGPDRRALAASVVLGLLVYLPSVWRLRRPLRLDRLVDAVGLGGRGARDGVPRT